MSWLSSEIHGLEADAIRWVANDLVVPNEAKLTTLIGTGVPVGVDALVTLIEKDDTPLGPAVSALINGIVNSYKAGIETELSALAATGATADVPNLVTAMLNYATKLAAS